MDIAFQRFGNGRTLPFSNLFPLSCYHPDNLGFGNKLPFDGKSIRQEKERGKEKSRARGKGYGVGKMATVLIEFFRVVPSLPFKPCRGKQESPMKMEWNLKRTEPVISRLPF